MAISEAVLSNLRTLEARRVAGRAKAWKAVWWILGIGGGLAGLLFVTGSPWWAFLAVVLALVVAGIAHSSTMGQVSSAFKDEILPKLLAGIDGSLVYESAGSIGEGEFKASRLFKAPDRYGGKDLVSGYVGDTHVRFSMVDAEEKIEDTRTHTDSDGHTHTETTTHYETIFCGLLFTADFNKQLAGATIVNPGGGGVFSRLSGGRVKLEDPRFNREFSAYATDQVEARYVLTPSMMERLVALKSKFGAIGISFIQDRMYLAAGLNYHLFEPDLSRPLTELPQVENLLANLERITGIVTDLDLNTRIWTKAGRAAQRA